MVNVPSVVAAVALGGGRRRDVKTAVSGTTSKDHPS